MILWIRVSSSQGCILCISIILSPTFAILFPRKAPPDGRGGGRGKFSPFFSFNFFFLFPVAIPPSLALADKELYNSQGYFLPQLNLIKNRKNNPNPQLGHRRKMKFDEKLYQTREAAAGSELGNS